MDVLEIGEAEADAHQNTVDAAQRAPLAPPSTVLPEGYVSTRHH